MLISHTTHVLMANTPEGGQRAQSFSIHDDLDEVFTGRSHHESTSTHNRANIKIEHTTYQLSVCLSIIGSQHPIAFTRFISSTRLIV
jgi:hypothetical protein